MKVLFVKDLPGTAYAGDIKDVKNGFARNYLFPNSLAVMATNDQLNRVKSLQAGAKQRKASEEKEMTALADLLSGKQIVMEVRAGRNDRLYGSITNAAIAEEVSKIIGKPIDRRTIGIEPIRQLGSYTIPVKLGHGIEAPINVVVTPIGGVIDTEVTAEEVMEALDAEDASLVDTVDETTDVASEPDSNDDQNIEIDQSLLEESDDPEDQDSEQKPQSPA